MESFTLIGHSGCRLEVEERDGNLVVVKTAKDKAYGERLKKQHDKQKGFGAGTFHTPRVIDCGYDEDGLFKFSMEYVNGVTLAEHLKQADISSIKTIAEKFLSLIPESYDFDPTAKEIFSAKIKELEQKLGANGDAALAKAFEKLNNYHWAYCAAGDCHGDMALENIIWKNGDFYLVDFLDSFYDSWMIDLSKLLLDAECLWSYRHMDRIDENLKIRLLIFKKILWERLLSLKDGEKILNTIYYMLLVHLIRIVPYTQDEKTRSYLVREVDKICDIINSL